MCSTYIPRGLEGMKWNMRLFFGFGFCGFAVLRFLVIILAT